jgi:hypothetical protein
MSGEYKLYSYQLNVPASITFLSSSIQRHVVQLMSTYVSEEHIASILDWKSKTSRKQYEGGSKQGSVTACGSFFVTSVLKADGGLLHSYLPLM